MNDQQKVYEDFIRFYEDAGLEFPCTALQFWARAVEYTDGNDELIDRLCQQGIGPNWRN